MGKKQKSSFRMETAFVVSAMTNIVRIKPTSECGEPA